MPYNQQGIWVEETTQNQFVAATQQAMQQGLNQLAAQNAAYGNGRAAGFAGLGGPQYGAFGQAAIQMQQARTQNFLEIVNDFVNNCLRLNLKINEMVVDDATYTNIQNELGGRTVMITGPEAGLKGVTIATAMGYLTIIPEAYKKSFDMDAYLEDVTNDIA